MLTNQMNSDILEGKRRAQELVASDNASLNRNGRKKATLKSLNSSGKRRDTDILLIKVRIYVIKHRGWRKIIKRSLPMRAV